MGIYGNNSDTLQMFLKIHKHVHMLENAWKMKKVKQKQLLTQGEL